MSKSCWNIDKTFPTNVFTCENITKENKGKLTVIFSTHHINIVESSSGIPFSTTENSNNPLEDPNTVKNIIEKYKNHPSIIDIRNY